jgi:predicted O-methyltransferase YrrM
MRYDTVVSFFRDADGKYNPRTHKHNNEPIFVDSVFANVTDLGLKNQIQLLGGIKQGSKTVRMTENLDENWDYMTIDSDERKYRFISSLNMSKGYAVIVGEDVGL